MECSFPITVRNPKTQEYMKVPCGRCVPCMERRQKDWAFRLQQELKSTNGRSIFVTLTYNDEHLPWADDQPTLVKKDFQDFMKRFRKHFPDHKLRYFACGEYGFHPRTGLDPRPHYHALIFGLPNNTALIEDKLNKSWTSGFITFDDVTRARCFYVAKYVIKPQDRKDDFDKIQRPFALMSIKPGIGECYIDKSRTYHRLNKAFFCVDSHSQKVAMPRYYKERIFTEIQRKRYAAECSWKAEVKERKKLLPFRLKGYSESDSWILSGRRFEKDRLALEKITYKRLYEKAEL